MEVESRMEGGNVSAGQLAVADFYLSMLIERLEGFGAQTLNPKPSSLNPKAL